MKRKLVAFTTCLALLLSIVATAAVSAHTVTVDGLLSDWFGANPPRNSGYIARNVSQQGEFFWRDALDDQRIVATAAITKNVDLTAFRVTADTTNLYLLMRVNNLTQTSGSQVVEFQVGIDTGAGGTTTLVGNAATSVTSSAAWEYLLQTQFKNGSTSPPLLYTSPNTSSSTGLAGSLLAGDSDLAEVSIPWSKIGGLPSTATFNRLRFTVATLYSDGTNANDGLSSKVMDTMNPTSSASADLADGTIDYYVDVLFDSHGEVIAPLLVSEFLANPSGSGSEWIEIHNPNNFQVPLNQFKVGDGVTRNPSSNEGMFQFPASTTIAGGSFVIVARDRDVFKSQHPGVTAPVYGIASQDASFLMTKYAAWGGDTKIDLDNVPTPEEQIVLLDGSDTIVDLVNYAVPGATGTTFGHTPITVPSTGVALDHSYERCPSNRDTNDNSFDFVERTLAEQTPGVACTPPAGPDLFITKSASPTVANVSDTITYIISFGNQGGSAAASILVTDTLPVGMSCTSQSASPGVVFTGNCGSNSLSWTLTTLTANATGIITLTATINSGAPNADLVNRVRISSASADTNPANDTYAATVSIFGPPALSIGSTWPATAAPDEEFQYTITYQNTGAADANNVTITDALPAGVTLVSEDSPGASFNNATSGNLVWTVPSLAAGESGTITLVVKLSNSVASGPLSHTLTITGAAPVTETLTVGQHKVFLPLISK